MILIGSLTATEELAKLSWRLSNPSLLLKDKGVKELRVLKFTITQYQDIEMFESVCHITASLENVRLCTVHVDSPSDWYIHIQSVSQSKRVRQCEWHQHGHLREEQRWDWVHPRGQDTFLVRSNDLTQLLTEGQYQSLLFGDSLITVVSLSTLQSINKGEDTHLCPLSEDSWAERTHCVCETFRSCGVGHTINSNLAWGLKHTFIMTWCNQKQISWWNQEGRFWPVWRVQRLRMMGGPLSAQFLRHPPHYWPLPQTTPLENLGYAPPLDWRGRERESKKKADDTKASSLKTVHT